MQSIMPFKQESLERRLLKQLYIENEAGVDYKCLDTNLNSTYSIHANN